MFDKILLPLVPDEQVTWQKALPMALGLAQTHDAELLLMTVVPVFGSNIVASYFPPDFEHKALEHARGELAALAGKQLPDGLRHRLFVAHGRVWQEICRVAKEEAADLVVMASHRPELRDVLLSPNADQVLHHASLSVMIVR